MFDKENFVKALMFLAREAHVGHQEHIVAILEETINKVVSSEEDSLGRAQEGSPIHQYSDIIKNFLELDPSAQKTLIAALERAELTL